MSQSADIYFVGAYVKDIVDLGIASLVSGVHVSFVGPPGCGKTAILRALAEALVSQLKDKKWSFTRFDPATPVEVISGIPDPAALMGDPPRYELRVEGTPYEPGTVINLLDEWTRANDPMHDRFIDVLDRQDFANGDAPPVCWGTANFITQGERFEAVRDRFGAWMHVKASKIPASVIGKVAVMSGGKPKLHPSLIPAWDDIAKARRAKPDDQTWDIVGRYLDQLEAEAATQGMAPHNRTKDQWARLLYHYAVFLTGSTTFSTLPTEAIRMMRYAYPAADAAEQQKWTTVILNVVDPVEALVDATLAQAVDKFREVAAMPDGQRMTQLNDLGNWMQEKQKKLRELGGDPRLADAAQKMQIWFGAVASGNSEVINR